MRVKILEKRIIEKTKQIEKNDKELNNIISNEKKIKSRRERRERAHKLIKKGAIFEGLNLLEESQEVMVGYLKEFKKLTTEEKMKFYNIGKEELIGRKKKRVEESWGPSTQEILKLLQEAHCSNKSRDCMTEVYKRYKKTNLESLTKKEYEELMRDFKG